MCYCHSPSKTVTLSKLNNHDGSDCFFFLFFIYIRIYWINNNNIKDILTTTNTTTTMFIDRMYGSPTHVPQHILCEAAATPTQNPPPPPHFTWHFRSIHKHTTLRGKASNANIYMWGATTKKKLIIIKNKTNY